jgi:thiamine-monophosphate kinase
MNKEQEFISALTRGHRHSPYQLNRIHESDAELVQISPNDPILAITTDSLAEEMAYSLYKDAFQIGWMAVLCSASDLAAVGAEPLGILISATFTEESNAAQIQSGIRKACEAFSLPLLGGDTNFSSQLNLTGTALGLIKDRKPLMRIGYHPGDILAYSGPLGSGNLFAYQKLFCNDSSNAIAFQPEARLREGVLLTSYASACIDTSDGFFSSLDDLMGVNPYGFEINAPIESLLSKEILSYPAPFSLNLFLAGHHGEYELLFTIPPEKWDRFVRDANEMGWEPLMAGKVVEKPGIHTSEFSLAPGTIRKTWDDAKGNVSHYFNLLLGLVS